MKTAIDRILDDQEVLWRVFFPFRIKNRLAYIYRVARLCYRELRSPVWLPLKHHIRAWRHGMRRSSYRRYGLEYAGNIHDYISDFSAIKQVYLNGRNNELLANKLAFHFLMQSVEAPVPRLYGVIQDGVFHVEGSAETLTPAEMLNRLCVKGHSIVFKPVWGQGGKGFFVLTGVKQGYVLNHESVSQEELIHLIGQLNGYMVMEFAQQGVFGESLYGDTANTLRIMTLQDIDGSGAFISMAAMRVGTLRSYPRDSFAGGGVMVPIELDSGRLGMGLQKVEGEIVSHTHHPDSHAQIEGAIIPGWDEICRDILELSNKLSYIPNIGWDILQTKTGYTIIEGNGAPDLSIQELGPLLKEPRVRRFYSHYGMI